MPNWGDVLNEIKTAQANPTIGAEAVDYVRRKYLAALHAKTNRNVIAYYSGFLSKPDIDGQGIIDEDKNGFMMVVHRLDRKLGLDLILHTPGGNIAATQTIVDYLHKMFGSDIRAIVPQIAMSGGTMVACSCREILMGTHSNLGPIDPQIRNIPAAGVVLEFKRAMREVKRNPTSIGLWGVIIGQYRPTFLSQCENALIWSNQFVREQLTTVMFAGQPDAATKAKHIVTRLTDYRGNKDHSRHIHYDECAAMGLNVSPIEKDPDLQDLILTVHHCYMHSLMNTGAYKMIENHLGVAFVKQQITLQQMIVPGP